MDLVRKLFCQLLFPTSRMNFRCQLLNQHGWSVLKVPRKNGNMNIDRSVTSGQHHLLRKITWCDRCHTMTLWSDWNTCSFMKNSLFTCSNDLCLTWSSDIVGGERLLKTDSVNILWIWGLKHYSAVTFLRCTKHLEPTDENFWRMQWLCEWVYMNTNRGRFPFPDSASLWSYTSEYLFSLLDD